MAKFATQIGDRAVAQSWFHEEEQYVFVLNAAIDSSDLPADVDQQAGYIAQFAIPAGNGYPGVLGPYVFGDPIYNPSESQYGVPPAVETLTATGGAFQFSAYAACRGSKGLPPQSCNLSGSTFTANDHGLVVDDRVVIFTDGGSLPTGYSPGLTCKISTATANTFEIVNLDDSAIALSDAGSNLYVAEVGGSWHFIETFDTPQVLQDGEEQEFRLGGSGNAEVDQ